VPPRDFTARIRRRDMVSWRHQHRAPGHPRLRRGIAAIGAIGLVLGAIGWGEPGSMPPPRTIATAGCKPCPPPISAPCKAHRAACRPIRAARRTAPGARQLGQPPVDRTLRRDPFRRRLAFRGRAFRDRFSRSAGRARPLFAAGDAQDRWRALQCLTAAIYYEAASEPDAGQRAVAQVVLNRVAHPAFPKTVCGVVFQGSERPAASSASPATGPWPGARCQQFWDRARRVAADALDGQVFAPVGLATHYHTSAVHPGWADKLAFIGTIGAHRFYRWSGAAGLPAAFTGDLSRGEPSPRRTRAAGFRSQPTSPIR
jgi:hypothetical protein